MRDFNIDLTILSIVITIMLVLTGINVMAQTNTIQEDLTPNVLWEYQMTFDPIVLEDPSEVTRGTGFISAAYVFLDILHFTAELDQVANRPVVTATSTDYLPPPEVVVFTLEESVFLKDYGYLYVWKYDQYITLYKDANVYVFAIFNTYSYYDGIYYGAVGHDDIIYDQYDVAYFEQTAGGDWE
ncbi:MAG: hypothetical protein GSR81_04840 [Desulfurococcales archaeon]|nr:hypothetical protein [Desulfurococcales archaeon]